MELISVIVPCYNEQEAIPYFYEEICSVMNKMPEYRFEIIFANDGSKDNTMKLIKDLASKDDRVKYVSFSRNFGKETAIYAGLDVSKGDYVTLMDADLQDPPALLPKMMDAITKEGYDSAATRRVTRSGEPPVRSFFARQFYKIINKISDVNIVDGARDYRLMTRQMVDTILALPERGRFSKGIFGWIGFDTKWIEFENVDRVAGETKWTFWSLLLYSLDGIASFSTVPLHIATITGLVMLLIVLIMAIIFLVRFCAWGFAPSLVASLSCMILMVGGILCVFMGIIGQYLARTYIEVQKRPIYILKETNIKKED